MESGKIASVAFIALLGAMSPGPAFAIVAKNCFKGHFRSGLMTALGLASGLLVHVSYCLFGIGILIQESLLLFNILKYLGAGYLFYLGVLLLKEKMAPDGTEKDFSEAAKKNKSPFISGFLCNLLNPSVTLFILSLFTQFVDSSMPIGTKALLGIVVAAVSFTWFTALSFLITHRLLQKHFANFRLIITRTMGMALVVLALYVAIFS